MKRVWILIGDKDTKKTSVTKCLTASNQANIKRNKNDNTAHEIEYLNGMRFSLVSYSSAMQEQNVSPEKMIEYLELEANSANQPSVQNRLICLHFNSSRKCPTGKEYVEMLLQNNWQVECIISLGQQEPSWLRQSGLLYAAIKDSKLMPGTVVAHKVRQLFQWK